MDLPELLEPERIRCHCDIHSKKRALQTLAELLGTALRAGGGGDAPEAGGESGSPPGADAADPSPADAAPAAETSGTAPREEPSGLGRRLGLKGKDKKDHKDKEGRGARRGAKSRDADAAGEVSDMDILDALISRERLGSTGLGHGVALPHSRLDTVDAPLAAMITLNEGVDFESDDGEPVDLVLGLLVPRDCNDEHLAILANLARRFSDAELREALRGHTSGEELFAHLQGLAASGERTAPTDAR